MTWIGMTRRQVCCEIIPVRVVFFDQVDLPLPIAVFDLLLKADGSGNVLALLIPDKVGDIVFAGKSFQQMMFVLIHAVFQMTGDASVQSAAFFAGKDVNVGDLVHRWLSNAAVDEDALHGFRDFARNDDGADGHVKV
jgi:hypothetical protein